MGLLNFDIGSFSPKLIAAIIYTVGALFAFALFPTFNGAAQGWHLEARQEGSCETKEGTRFDRIVAYGYSSGAFSLGASTVESGKINAAFTGITGEESDPNKYDWNEGYTVDEVSGTCSVLSALGGAQAAFFTISTAATAAGSGKFLTADGTEVTVTFTDKASPDKSLAGATLVSPDYKWASPASMFNDNRAIVNILIGVTVLLIGVGPIALLGGIGIYLLNTFAGGMSGASKFLVATLGAIVAVTLLGNFTDFISIAYDTVDSDRFTMYGHSLARLAGTIKQFWGLIFAAGWVGLGGYFGWQAFQRYKAARSGDVMA